MVMHRFSKLHTSAHHGGSKSLLHSNRYVLFLIRYDLFTYSHVNSATCEEQNRRRHC